MTEVVLIDLDHISESPRNPRKHFHPKKLEELAASIREKGVIEPAIVRKVKHGYEIVAGHRRFRASKLAGGAIDRLPCLVHELTDDQALEFAVIENGQREDVSAVEEANGYDALMKMHKRYTVAEVAAKVGKSESYVYRRLKLLSLIPTLLTALEEGRLDLAHAEPLSRLAPAQQKDAAGLEADGQLKHSYFESQAKSVVWRSNPLLDGAKHVPTADDLRPLHELLAFIRKYSAVQPTAEDTRHFFPELADEISKAEEETPEGAVLELSDDIFVKTHLKAATDKGIPLNRNRWKEVKGPKACEFARRGAVTHGGPARVLWVCAKKGCPKHFPVAKKKAAPPSTGAARHEPTSPSPAQLEKERLETIRRDIANEVWQDMEAAVCTAVVKHLAAQKVTIALLDKALDGGDLWIGWDGQVHGEWSIKVTDKNIGQALALHALGHPSNHGGGAHAYLDHAKKQFGFNGKALKEAFDDRCAKEFADKQKKGKSSDAKAKKGAAA